MHPSTNHEERFRPRSPSPVNLAPSLAKLIWNHTRTNQTENHAERGNHSKVTCPCSRERTEKTKVETAGPAGSGHRRRRHWSAPHRASPPMVPPRGGMLLARRPALSSVGGPTRAWSSRNVHVSPSLAHKRLLLAPCYASLSRLCCSSVWLCCIRL